MESEAIGALRELSRAAFNQAYRLEVMLAIAESEDGLVTLSDLATTLDLPVSNVQKPLQSLIKVGLLSSAPQGDSRSKFYLRVDSAAWEWTTELKETAQQRLDTPATFRHQ